MVSRHWTLRLACLVQQLVQGGPTRTYDRWRHRPAPGRRSLCRGFGSVAGSVRDCPWEQLAPGQVLRRATGTADSFDQVERVARPLKEQATPAGDFQHVWSGRIEPSLRSLPFRGSAMKTWSRWCLSLAGMLCAMPLLAQSASFQFLGKPGAYLVGLKVVEQYDRSRSFPATLLLSDQLDAGVPWNE